GPRTWDHGWGWLARMTAATGLLVLGLIVHLAWRIEHVAPAWYALTVTAVLAAGAVLGLTTWHYSAARPTHQRVHVAATVAAGALGLAVTLVAGWWQPWLWAYLFASLAFATSWAVRTVPAVHGDWHDHGQHAEPAPSGWEQVGLHPETKVRDVENTGGRITGTIRTAGAEGIEDVQSAGTKLRNLAGV